MPSLRVGLQPSHSQVNPLGLGLDAPALPRHAGAPKAQAPISANILTKNSARRLAQVLTALAWCDEVVVFDTGSTDETLEIARSFANVKLHVMDGAFPGFGRAHRQAVALSRNDWILSIDSDEVVSSELMEELASLKLAPRTVYTIPFENYFNTRHITSCGWYPERHERLFNRSETNFCESAVHERVQSQGLAVHNLQRPIRHYSYDSADDLLRKMRAYAQLFAEHNAGRKRSSPAKAVGRSLWAFFRSYLLRRGITQGYEGFIISASQAQGTFWKYLLLHEANRRNQLSV